MKTRAVIFDLYNTLLKVGPPPPDADVRWSALFRELFGSEPPFSRLDFSVACGRAVVRHHEAARAAGIPFPEVQWPTVVAEILPAFPKLWPELRAEFVYRQTQTGRTTAMSAKAAAALGTLHRAGCRLGIASNAQAYSLRELREGLASQQMAMDVFESALCFWSFEHGFSKPDPHVFRILTARCEAMGIGPGEMLMVGDRLDNDLEPAQRHGWQTFQVGTTTPDTEGSDWDRLLAVVLG